MTEHSLPPGFEKLAAWTAEWMLADHMERQLKRGASTLDQVKAFYDAMFPEMERIMTYLKTVPMEAPSQADKNLYRLAATFFEMSHPIDLSWPDTEQRNIFPVERIGLVEPSPAD
jgi:hypothetical protein